MARSLFVADRSITDTGTDTGDWYHALADDFERHGAEVIERVRIEKRNHISRSSRLAGAKPDSAAMPLKVSAL
jgi:hypothetical protein